MFSVTSVFVSQQHPSEPAQSASVVLIWPHNCLVPLKEVCCGEQAALSGLGRI